MTHAIPSQRSLTSREAAAAPLRTRLAVGRAHGSEQEQNQQQNQQQGPQPSAAAEAISAPVRLSWVDPVSGAHLEIVLDVTPAMLCRLEEEGFRVEPGTERQAS